MEPDMMKEGFPARLQKLRERQHRSRKVVSELCGLHPGAIARYERGEVLPDIVSLMALAKYYGVTTDYLLFGGSSGGKNEEKFVEAWPGVKVPIGETLELVIRKNAKKP